MLDVRKIRRLAKTNSIHFDITTTAVLRPEILEQNYSSFKQKLLNVNWGQCRLFINIDPCPQSSIHLVDEVKKVALRHFSNVTIRAPERAGFSTAVNWLWSQAESPFLFHLEDDWVLRRPISIVDILKMLVSHDSLNMIRFRHKVRKKCKYGLSPCIMKRRFYHAFAGNLDPNLDPEQQINRRCHEFGLSTRSPNTVILWPTQPLNDIVLNHPGLHWRTSRGIAFVNAQGEGATKLNRVTWSE